MISRNQCVYLKQYFSLACQEFPREEPFRFNAFYSGVPGVLTSFEPRAKTERKFMDLWVVSGPGTADEYAVIGVAAQSYSVGNRVLEW